MFVGNQQIAAQLSDLVNVYAIDLPQPVATEVLLVVDEVLRIVGISTYWREAIYGPRVTAYLDEWDLEIGPSPAPGAGLAPWAGRLRPIRRAVSRLPAASNFTNHQ